MHQYVKYLKNNKAYRTNEKSHKTKHQLIHSVPDYFAFQVINNTVAVLAMSKMKCGNSLWLRILMILKIIMFICINIIMFLMTCFNV